MQRNSALIKAKRAGKLETSFNNSTNEKHASKTIKTKYKCSYNSSTTMISETIWTN